MTVLPDDAQEAGVITAEPIDDVTYRYIHALDCAKTKARRQHKPSAVDCDCDAVPLDVTMSAERWVKAYELVEEARELLAKWNMVQPVISDIVDEYNTNEHAKDAIWDIVDSWVGDLAEALGMEVTIDDGAAETTGPDSPAQGAGDGGR